MTTDSHPDYSEWTELAALFAGEWHADMALPPTWHDLPAGCLGARIRLRTEDRVLCTLRFSWGAMSVIPLYREGGNWKPGPKIVSVNHRGRIADPYTGRAEVTGILRAALAEIEAE